MSGSSSTTMSSGTTTVGTGVSATGAVAVLLFDTISVTPSLPFNTNVVATHPATKTPQKVVLGSTASSNSVCRCGRKARPTRCCCCCTTKASDVDTQDNVSSMEETAHNNRERCFVIVVMVIVVVGVSVGVATTATAVLFPSLAPSCCCLSLSLSSSFLLLCPFLIS